MATRWLTVDEPGPRPYDNTILIEDEYDNTICITTDLGLELAYLLMSICKGQGSGQTHTIPKDKGK